MRRALVALTLAAAAGGCGGETEAEAPAPPPRGEPTLTVEVRPQGPTGPVQRREIACPSDAVCDGLDPADFAPVPPDVACTEIYGGPATARVTGELRGRRIQAEFSRENGCEIARWDRLQALLGAPPGG